MHRTRLALNTSATASEGLVRRPVTRVRRHADEEFKPAVASAFVSISASDAIAEEAPVALSYNGIAHAVMMATPLDLEDYAVGFSLSEGIVDTPQQIYDLQATVKDNGIALDLNIATSCMARLSEHRRTLTGRSGCGVCGTESLAMLNLQATRLEAQLQLHPQALIDACAQLQSQQLLNTATGAVHAAAWADLDGHLLCVREDIGRHNALDKLIGALARQHHQRQPGFCLMTSRASYELVQRAARAQMSILVAISAPTSLAVQMAEEAGMTLIGFARNESFVVYAGGEALDAATNSTLHRPPARSS